MAPKRLKKVWQRLSGQSAPPATSPTAGTPPVEPETGAVADQPRSVPGVPDRVLHGWADFATRVEQERASADPAPQDLLTQVLGERVTPFLDEVERATDDQWASIHEHLSRWWAAIPDPGQIPVEQRVKALLAATDQRTVLAEFCASRWFEHGWFATEVSHGHVRAVLPGLEHLDPDDLLLAPHEVTVRGQVRGVTAAPDGWVVEAFLGLERVSLPTAPAVEVWLEGRDGSRLDLPAPHLRHDPRANHGDAGGHRYQDHAPGAARILVPRDLVTSHDGPWQLMARITSQGVHRTGAITDIDRRGSARRRPTGPGPVNHVQFDGNGWLQAVHATGPTPDPTSSLVLDQFQVTGDRLLVRGTWHGAAPRIVLVPDDDTREQPVTGTWHDEEGDAFSATFPLTRTRWGRAEQWLGTGRFWFRATTAAGTPVPAVLSGQAEADTLTWQLGTEYEARWVSLGAERTAGLLLRAPLAPQERGPYHQWRLQQEALNTAHPIAADTVYLQCFQGQSASDAQLALRHEIRRTRPDLTVVWGVAEAATWTPEGDHRVLLNSAAWYRAVTTAGYLSQNGDVDRWYRRQEGQRFLATFHGYPSKTMGIGMWQAKDFTPLRIAHELGRTRDVWSVIITPQPDMNRYYRENYDWDGEIIAQGLPRDDSLRGPDTAAVRARTRALLQIADHDTAVLYAPTWRDDKATGWREAEAVNHLDIEAASAALGPEVVFLMRGHRFTPPHRGSGSARFVDVTDHPEINDLILASDAAVLDYSSLRFDFSLTGRPMVFLVPDLAEYTGSVRGFLYDYLTTAPGPLVDTVEEVVAALADLPALRAAHAGQYAAFDAQFNGFMDGHAAERVAKAWLAPAPARGQ